MTVLVVILCTALRNCVCIRRNVKLSIGFQYKSLVCITALLHYNTTRGLQASFVLLANSFMN